MARADSARTSTRCGSTPRAHVSGSESRSGGTAGTRGGTPPAPDAARTRRHASPHGPSRPRARAPRRTRRRSSARARALRARGAPPSTCSRRRRRRAGRGGRRRAAGSAPWPEGARRRRTTDVSSANRSGPRCRVRPSSSLSTGPFHCAASHRDVRSTSQGRSTPRRRAALPDGPAPVHAEMAPHGDASLEAEQEVLPDRIDGLEHAAVDGTGDVRHEPARAR